MIINANIFGLGPEFKLEFTLENNGMKALHNLRATISHSSKGLKLEKSQFSVCTLLPSVQYSFVTNLRCTASTAAEDSHVKVLVSRQESCVPLLSAIVKLPLVEPEEGEGQQMQADFGYAHRPNDSGNADMLVMG